MRYAIAVEGASMPVLEKFTGMCEAIYDTETLHLDLESIFANIIVDIARISPRGRDKIKI